MEKVREDFEVWAIEKDLDISHYVDDGKIGDYCDVVTQYAWLGWKVSRAELCVVLPSYRCDHYYKDGVLDANKVFEALEKAGVPYK